MEIAFAMWLLVPLRIALSALVLAFLAIPASAEYVVRSGDVLEIDIVGLSNLRQKLPVSVDGTVRIPIIGPVDVDGKTLTEITETIQTRLGSQTIRQTSPTGQDFQIFLEPNQIQIFVAEFRPIYVSGDVARPGEQPYRPGMTVRQSISIAGGYDIMPNRTFDPFMQASDLSAELDALRLELARDQIRIHRIKIELAGETTPKGFANIEVDLAPDQKDHLISLERDRFLINVANLDKEMSFLKTSLDFTTAQMTTLTEQMEREREGMTVEQEESDRLDEIAKKGLTNTARTFEARRSMLFASARYLQTVAQVTQLQRDQADLNRQLAKLIDTRHTELLEELQNTIIHADVATSKIRSTVDKLVYTSGARSPLQQGATKQPVLSIIRHIDGKPLEIEADEDVVLMPGDVVEAKLTALVTNRLH